MELFIPLNVLHLDIVKALEFYPSLASGFKISRMRELDKIFMPMPV